MKNLLRRLHLSSPPTHQETTVKDDAEEDYINNDDHDISSSSSKTTPKTGLFLLPEAASGLLTAAKNSLSHTSHTLIKSLRSSSREGVGGGEEENSEFEGELEGEKEEERHMRTYNHTHKTDVITGFFEETNPVRSELEQEHHAAMDAVAASTTSSLAALALDSRARSGSNTDIATAMGEASIQSHPLHRDQSTLDVLSGIGLQRNQTAVFRLVSDHAILLQDEDLQVQVAMALSVRDDPEAAAIEVAKDLTTPPPNNSTAELLAYQYSKLNILNYDDKVLDGFYDVYGITSDSTLEMMPTLINLQETPASDQMTYEVVLVNRVTDNNLVSLEQKAISTSLSSRVGMAGGMKTNGLIQRIADMVADQMGGVVSDSDSLHKMWGTSSEELRLSLGKAVLPLGRLQVGLERHRALLFKVLADAIGVPCQLVKGRKYTGSDENAINIIKIDAREYIVDLMGSPGTLSTYDPEYNLDQKTVIPCSSSAPDDTDGDHIFSKDVFVDDNSQAICEDPISMKILAGNVAEVKAVEHQESEPLEEVYAIPTLPIVNRPFFHWRSPSWTEGMQDSKVKDVGVSEYMIEATKEDPKLAKRLRDFLVENGLQPPSNLFNDIPAKALPSPMNLEVTNASNENQLENTNKKGTGHMEERNISSPGRSPSTSLTVDGTSEEAVKEKLLQRLHSVEGLGVRRPLNPSTNTSPNSSASPEAAVIQSSNLMSPGGTTLAKDNIPAELIKRVPVAAAAAATAAVVASSMVVAASKSDLVSDPCIEVPVAAAATATAAVLVATSAVVGRRIEFPVSDFVKEEALDEERVSGKCTGSVCAKSDKSLDDVVEWEIQWEELVVGERIGLGSYGEVYRGEWHGTEIAIKKFLEQDISGDALEEFQREVRLMKRMRHPNVVLFMGAVMQPPNLSIVTEFLPRGSLYRLIHRSNSNLDERRRMRMALDVARGMNYLHTSTPVIVHRDLKSPNLLVDKNWVVKVCDFGLSRMKHNTFLSSKSTAGTPEWMAPEVLRNEPSNEKSDVYSFGVILWELATLQQPWAGMNPMQVVGAVGFQYRTLDIPEDLDPAIITIIQQCWQSNPAARPSFGEIMHALKPLQRPTSQTPKA